MRSLPAMLVLVSFLAGVLTPTLVATNDPPPPPVPITDRADCVWAGPSCGNINGICNDRGGRCVIPPALGQYNDANEDGCGCAW